MFSCVCEASKRWLRAFKENVFRPFSNWAPFVPGQGRCTPGEGPFLYSDFARSLHSYERARNKLLPSTSSFKGSFTREAPREDHGPNAVSVHCLLGCWSTIQLRPDNFYTKEMLLGVIFSNNSYGH